MVTNLRSRVDAVVAILDVNLITSGMNKKSKTGDIPVGKFFYLI